MHLVIFVQVQDITIFHSILLIISPDNRSVFSKHLSLFLLLTLLPLLLLFLCPQHYQAKQKVLCSSNYPDFDCLAFSESTIDFYRSTDKGNSFQSISTPSLTGSPIASFILPNKRRVFFKSDPNEVWYIDEGTSTWSHYQLSGSLSPVCNCTRLSDYEFLYSTSDGATFSKIDVLTGACTALFNPLPGYKLLSCCVDINGYVYCSFDLNERLRITYDNFASFVIGGYIPRSGGMSAMTFLRETTFVCIAKNQAAVFITTNRFNSFSQKFYASDIISYNSIWCNTFGFILVTNNTNSDIIRSVDAGLTFTRLTPSSPQSFSASLCVFNDGNVLVGTGNSGVVLRASL